jgi:acyl dehydratase
VTAEADIVGRTASQETVITQALVAAYADVVQDHNPIHIEPSAAAETRFGRPIAHGMLIGSLFSGLIARELPGPGSIYLSQSLRFRRPVFVGQTVHASVRCTAVDRGRATLSTEVTDPEGEVLVDGEAIVLLPE